MGEQTKSRADGSAFGRTFTPPSWHDAGILALCLTWFAALFASPAGVPEPLPDFGELDASARKAAFFDYLSPFIDKVNDRTRMERAFVSDMLSKRASGDELSWFETRRVMALAAEFEVATDGRDPDAVLATLDRRIGIIPESLVLIQAAKESGWGTSRFAVEGNNLFGQRCYEESCGIAPRGRANPRFGLAAFDSVEASIESYAQNLNTHPRYESFRDLRQTLRAAGRPLKGLDLAQGLIGYSERGQAYVDEIRSMIRQNGLE